MLINSYNLIALVFELLTIYSMHHCSFHILWLNNCSLYQWCLDIILQRADYCIKHTYNFSIIKYYTSLNSYVNEKRVKIIVSYIQNGRYKELNIIQFNINEKLTRHIRSNIYRNGDYVICFFTLYVSIIMLWVEYF